MKMTAKIVPYSSVVGSSVTLHAESGMTVCQLSLLNVIPPSFKFTPELHREASTRIAEWVAAALNNAGDFEPTPLEDSKATLADANSIASAPAQAEALPAGVDQECAYCAGTGWFYQEPELGRCACGASPAPDAKGER